MSFNTFYAKTLTEDISRQERVNALKGLPSQMMRLYTVFILVVPPDGEAGVAEFEVQAVDPERAQAQAVKEWFNEYGYEGEEIEKLYNDWVEGTDSWAFDEYRIEVIGVYLGKLNNLAEYE